MRNMSIELMVEVCNTFTTIRNLVWNHELPYPDHYVRSTYDLEPFRSDVQGVMFSLVRISQFPYWKGTLEEEICKSIDCLDDLNKATDARKYINARLWTLGDEILAEKPTEDVGDLPTTDSLQLSNGKRNLINMLLGHFLLLARVHANQDTVTKKLLSNMKMEYCSMIMHGIIPLIIKSGVHVDTFTKTMINELAAGTTIKDRLP